MAEYRYQDIYWQVQYVPYNARHWEGFIIWQRVLLSDSESEHRMTEAQVISRTKLTLPNLFTKINDDYPMNWKTAQPWPDVSRASLRRVAWSWKIWKGLRQSSRVHAKRVKNDDDTGVGRDLMQPKDRFGMRDDEFEEMEKTLDYFREKKEVIQTGDWGNMQLNILDKVDACNQSARALTEKRLPFIAARKLHQ